MFPLPLPGGRDLAMTFQSMVQRGEKKVSRSALKNYCRTGGFTPVVTMLEPADDDLARAGKSLFRHLARNGDGRLTRAELGRTSSLLRKLDEDDDEVLSVAEVAGSEKSPPTTKTVLRLAGVGERRDLDGAIRLTLVKGPVSPALTRAGKEISARHTGNLFRLQARDVSLTARTDGETNGSFADTRKFYLAQFKTLLGDNASLTKSAIEEDATAQGLADLFDAADRNGDGKLTLAEMVSFLDLIEQGIDSQVMVTVRDDGRNLFAALDTNGDGRLDLGELNRAAKVLPGDRTSLTAEQVPLQLRLSWGRGAARGSFGPLPLPARKKSSEAAPKVAFRGPAWFRAMDRNGDGYLSPREFLGSPARFRELDLDGDGRISVEEAEKAEKRKKVGK
jgi:Ca2+-binding EF-hand superfamily protein